MKKLKSEISRAPDKDNIQNFEAQFKRSTTQLLVLYLLSKREMYAYDIIRETLALSNNIYKMPLLYNILNKLETDGYVTQSRREISDNNRVRIYYKITENGQQYLSGLTDSYLKLSKSVNHILSGGGLNTNE
jgi:PadR family transcriptional regulator PadR